MAGKIFISYRRDDARADARSIYQRLERTFGARRLFIDVDTIERGRDFTKVLDQYLSDCTVMLPVIGSKWLSAKTDEGHRRLDDPADFVRLEIAKALARDIPVIPILVDGARMPKAADLPDDLKPLAKRQASTVGHETFPRDLDSLERDIKKLQKGAPRRSLWWIAVAAVAAALLFFAYKMQNNKTPTNFPSGTAPAVGVEPEASSQPTPLPQTTARVPVPTLADNEISMTLAQIEEKRSACRISLVFESKLGATADTLKFDTVVFAPSGVIQRRFAVDAAPLPTGFRKVKTFELGDLKCIDIGSILVNEIMDCQSSSKPIAACKLDNLSVRSDVPGVSLSK